MIKAVIFDLNGIFILGPSLSESEKSERELKIPIQEFMQRLKKEEKISEKMVTFAKGLKNKGIKVFMLSNALKEAALYYREQYPEINECAEKMYFSFETGFKKPDVRAWKNILSENNLKPEECIYFDDQEKHLKASESVGIKSFLFTDEKDLQDKINNKLS